MEDNTEFTENNDIVQYDFTYVDQFGLSSHMCKQGVVVDSITELPQLLSEFKNFLHMCGYSWVKDIQVVKNNDEIITTEF